MTRNFAVFPRETEKNSLILVYVAQFILDDVIRSLKVGWF